jgi:hypothetical protein
MEFTLSNVISRRFCDPEQGWIDKDFELTEAHKAAFLDIVAKGCSQARKAKLAAFIKYPYFHKDRYEYKRIVFDSDGVPCQFFPSQDWNSEIAELRKLICK